MIKQAVFYMVIADALLVLGLGFATSMIVLFNIDVGEIAKRVWPAVGILVATNVAAGLIMLAARWVSP